MHLAVRSAGVYKIVVTGSSGVTVTNDYTGTVQKFITILGMALQAFTPPTAFEFVCQQKDQTRMYIIAKTYTNRIAKQAGWYRRG